MANPWIEKGKIQTRLASFFSENRGELQDFGSTVNQTFEAFVFASIVKWYVNHGWSVEFKNPQSKRYVKLKYSTRGRPSLYTYALCTKGDQKIQIRHNLRVATRHHREGLSNKANVVLDVAVLSDFDLSNHKTDDHLENSYLITFGEAKHMSAFAELIANFIGLVHEMLPDKIKPRKRRKLRQRSKSQSEHPAPFLYVSGYLYPTAQGILETIKDRGYDIEIYDYLTGANMFGVKLPVTFQKRQRKTTKVRSFRSLQG
jgi:hypothetical protein